jgi:hypothetical protein
MVVNRDLVSQKLNPSDFQPFFNKFYSRFINGELHERQVILKYFQKYLHGN